MKILAIDDDFLLCLDIAEQLREQGHTVEEAASGNQGIQLLRLKSDHFDMIITDVQMPNGNGIEVLQFMLKEQRNVPTYVHSGVNSFRYPGQEPIDLATYVPYTFPFALFSLKNTDMMNSRMQTFITKLRPRL